MKSIDVFTARDLRNRSGKLMRDAEQGHLSLITKHGRPKMVAVPFDEKLLEHGVHHALALHLFESGKLTLVQAAKLADMKLNAFIRHLGEAGVHAQIHHLHIYHSASFLCFLCFLCFCC